MKANIPKYRAYIKKTGEMHEVDLINLWSNHVCCMLPSMNSDATASYRMRFFSFDEIELMQSINKLSVEDNFIYEDDIVSYEVTQIPYNTKKTFFGIVKFSAYYSEYILVNIKTRKYIGSISDKIDLKIIGNVYQNSELLESQK